MRVKVVDGGKASPDFIGTNDLARLVGVTRQVIDALVKDGVIQRSGHNAFEFEATITALFAHYRARAAQWATGDDGANLTAERARLAREQADGQALKNAQARGELIRAEDAERAWADFLRQARGRILAVPARLRCAGDVTGAAAEAVDAALRAALADLGGGDGG